MKRLLALSLSCLSLSAPLFGQRTLTVDPTGGADFAELQPAIDAAVDGDTVRLKAGEYSFSRPFTLGGKAIVIRGDAPDLTTIRVTRSGSVVFDQGESEATVLESISIVGGGPWAVTCTATSPTFRNCTISGSAGVGLLCKDGASPTLVDCKVTDHRGSGVVCVESSPTLTRCEISRNAGSGQAGIDLDASSPTLTDCTIVDNEAYGVRCSGDSSPTLTNCTVSGSRLQGALCLDTSSPTFAYCTLRDSSGGVLILDDSTPALTNCTIVNHRNGGVGCHDNSAPTLTGCTIAHNTNGLGCRENSAPVLINCTIADNTAGTQYFDGLGVFCGDASSLKLVNCTISGNSSSGLYCSQGATPELTNCTVWDNGGGSIVELDNASAQVRFSCIEGGMVRPGEGNINDDPRFCGWESANVMVETQEGFEQALTTFSLDLSMSSPCLGGGEGGADIGADAGVCETAGNPERAILLRPGTYGLGRDNLAHRISIAGTDETETIIKGTVQGLRTGASLSRITLGGLRVDPGESPEIVSCTISDDFLSEDSRLSHGVQIREAAPTFVDCTIVTWVGVRGTDASPTLTGCTVNRGGLHFDGGSPFLMSCRITENLSQEDGGGLSFWRSTPTLTNCIVARNSGGCGGGIECAGNSFAKLTNCTIAGNSGTGIVCAPDSSLSLRNCIVWGNDGGPLLLTGCPVWVPDPEIVPAEVTITFSCIEGPDVWPGEGNFNSDPLFRDADDFRLEPGSPAIDSGSSDGAPTTDINGKGRPCEDGFDLGANESGDCPVPSVRFLRGDANADGGRNVTDAVFVLEHLFGGGGEPTCAKSADVNDNGTIDVADPVFLLNALFAGGVSIPTPFPDCGPDPTPDELPCRSFEGCP